MSPNNPTGKDSLQVHAVIRTYGFAQHAVRIAPLDDEWAIVIDAVLVGVCKCPASALLAAKRYLGVGDAE
jgi:hypothetical protein